MDAQHFPFYIILSNYVRPILFYQIRDHNVRQIRFHVFIKMRRCKRRVCKRKTLFGQPNVIFYDCFNFIDSFLEFHRGQSQVLQGDMFLPAMRDFQAQATCRLAEAEDLFQDMKTRVSFQTGCIQLPSFLSPIH